MGNQSCAPSSIGDEAKPLRRNTHHLYANGHNTQLDFPNDKLTTAAPAVARDSLEKLYKKILQPYQSKSIRFSRTTIAETHHSSHDVSFPSEEASIKPPCEFKLNIDSLPLNIGSSIFVFRNENDPTILKALITGPAFTPYAHGLFEFDIYLADTTYTQPRVHFCTTGENTVSFSANLPASGSIDLSNLSSSPLMAFADCGGNSDVSSLLVSLQGCLRAATIFNQTPEYAALTLEAVEGMREYKACCNIIKYATIQHAMLDYLINPPPEIRDFVQAYFCLKKDLILRECKKWLAEAQLDNGMYDCIAARNNPELAAELRNGAYFVRLGEVVNSLTKELGNLRLNEDSAALESIKRRGLKDSLAAQTF